MKKLLFLLIIVAAGIRLNAQQDHQYTQFMYNKLLYNPAYAGARGTPTLTGIFRSQWLGFDGAPQSGLLSFNSPFLTPRVGIGATLSYLKIGLQRDFHASVAYSYDLVAMENVSLRVGIQGSLRTLGVAFDDAAPFTIGDPSLDNQRVNDFYGNVGAGIYGIFMERYFAGFSVPRIYSNAIGLNSALNPVSAKEYRHFYGVAGGIFPLSEDINLMPAVLIKYVSNAPVDADLNVNLDIRQKVTAGISYRLGGNGPGESVDLLVFWQATPQVGVGASYDFTLSDLKDYNGGSIELLLQADLKKNKKKNVFSPRFFL
ncbi:MAG: type IX secretion system membrane protein PorP/SprF [Lewinellaceae bacterium]|jgi:type IX secretion system PorP/SprF family membrane protein|nr:type IX secretion system membrane protein PorP/SprF [Lewinellaceae bacterium]